MKKYNVTITETLQKTVTVEAESREAAEQLVSDRWRHSEYILDAEDFTGADFSAEERTPQNRKNDRSRRSHRKPEREMER